jgi:hypothetical protein
MGDVLYLSARYRMVLRSLLHRDIRKCSAAALATFARSGWVYGTEYQLTALGRRIAELSEAMPPDRDVELDRSHLAELEFVTTPALIPAALWAR